MKDMEKEKERGREIERYIGARERWREIDMDREIEKNRKRRGEQAKDMERARDSL